MGWESRTRKLAKALRLHRTGAGKRIAKAMPKGHIYENCLSIRDAIDKKKTVLHTPPLSLAVLLEGRGCNSNCIYCTHIALNGDDESFRTEYAPGKKLRHDIGYTFGTSQALIESIDELAPSIGSFRFGGGEPTLYPEFWQVVHMVQRNPHAVMSLCTNGIALTESMIREVILMPQFRQLVISMDAATADTYRHVRGGSFDKVCGNLRMIRELRTGKYPIVQLNYVVMRSNVHEIVPLVELSKELGVAQLNYILLIVPSASAHPDSPAWVSHVERLSGEDPDRELCVEILKQVEEAKARAKSYGIKYPIDRIAPAIYSRYPELSRGDAVLSTLECAEEDEEYFTGKPEARIKVDWPNVFCHQPFANFSVGHYRTNFCCYAKPEFMAANHMAFDDDNATLMELWNHPQIVKARELMYQGRADLVCRDRCPFVATGGLKRAELQ
jgi:MoaA/NifB/PqqE/SkfB family radical SAM enzyme